MKHFLPILLLAAPILPAAAQETPPADHPPLVGQPPAANATVVYKSAGDGMNVFFLGSSSSEPCANLVETGAVYDAELMQKKLLPFIAKAVRKAHAATKVYPKVETNVAADVPLQVMGHSQWWDSSPYWQSRGECGPLTARFTPAAGRNYLVLFTFAGDTCSMDVQDVTDTSAPAPVELTRLQCKRPGVW